MEILYYIIPPIILYIGHYFAMQHGSQMQQRNLHKPAKNVLFVLAHPDDECMFFTPTVMSMKKESNLFILVLSNGGYDGLGKIRAKEMEKAASAM